MAKFSVHGSDTNTDNTTIIYIAAHDSTPKRARVYDIDIGSKATPVDQSCGYEFQRFSAENATPGGTAKTPQKLDPADAVSSYNGVEAPTGEPTYTANEILLYLPVHQRSTFRWVAMPGGEMVIPANTDDGLGCQADSPSSAFAVSCCIHFDE